MNNKKERGEALNDLWVIFSFIFFYIVTLMINFTITSEHILPNISEYTNKIPVGMDALFLVFLIYIIFISAYYISLMIWLLFAKYFINSDAIWRMAKQFKINQWLIHLLIK